MRRLLAVLGSLRIAAPLLIAIAGVLAWGTIYETRFGTAAVQRFVYQAWWFQALLGFLAVNLAVAAASRWPWKRRHAPFVLAHLGIILILLGGILGGRFGLDGQLIIPEGQAERRLQRSRNVLVVRPANPGTPFVVPTNFETTAWIREPNRRFRVALNGGRAVDVLVDRYYPDAELREQVLEDGEAEFPAIQVALRHEEQEETVWLLALDPERFGLRWGELHLLFLEPATDAQRAQLLEPASAAAPRGTLAIQLSGSPRVHEIAVPEATGTPLPLEGTPYTVTLKAYFPDFALGADGPTSRSDEPNNPAVALLLKGPEGADPYLVFALHPDFPALHGHQHAIAAEVSYRHPAAGALPPQAVVIVRAAADGPDGDARLSAVLTGPAGERRVLERMDAGVAYTHPWSGVEFRLAAMASRARLVQTFVPRGDEVRAEALHVVLSEGGASADAWLGLRGAADLTLGAHRFTVQYRPDEADLPVTIKLLDFRKIDYPGTQMAAGFESDVQLSDPQRGLILLRTIKMNTPLRYRGFSFYQSSFIPGEVETTVLSVRSDPGTPLVYAGFLIVIGGVIAMFAGRRPSTRRRPHRKAHR